MLLYLFCGVCTAEGLFAYIEEAGAADLVTYNTMLKGFSARGDLKEAEKILEVIKRRKLQPDEVSFNLLVNAAVGAGNTERAWFYVEEIQRAKMTVIYLFIYLSIYLSISYLFSCALFASSFYSV